MQKTTENAADLITTGAHRQMVIIFNHADYPDRICAAIDPRTGVGLHQLRALAWLCMCCNVDRLSALASSSFVHWFADQPAGSYTPQEMEIIISLLSFLDSLAAIDQLG